MMNKPSYNSTANAPPNASTTYSQPMFMPTQMNPTAQNNNGTPRIAPPPKHLTTLTMKSFAPSLEKPIFHFMLNTSSTSTQNMEASDSHHLVYMPSQLSSYQLKQQSIPSNEGYSLVSTGHDTTFHQHLPPSTTTINTAHHLSSASSTNSHQI